MIALRNVRHSYGATTEQLGWAYAYDDNGTLLGEYGMGGAASSGSTQHIYLPTASGLPLPVAAIINGQHFAVHTDHLNTPRRLTRKNGQVAWQWAFSAFGETEPTTADKRFTSASTNPATGTTTAGAVTYNLRYPGQVFDKESGLHYNYYRTYDPKTGRYTQADPIGLEGGFNRFRYAASNPLNFTDPSELVVCVASITGRSITCKANNGETMTTPFRSGAAGPCQNNTSCEFKKNQGPAPRTSYNMLPPSAFEDTPPEKVASIYLSPQIKGAAKNRTGLFIHPPGPTEKGCIVIMSMKDFEAIYGMWQRDGSGETRVID